jgi:hypothetical protein
MRTRTATLPMSIGRSARYVRINRKIIIDLILQGITYLTFGMAVNLVWTGSRSIITLIYTYVLPIYQDMSNG